jgi:hypothetical protein
LDIKISGSEIIQHARLNAAAAPFRRVGRGAEPALTSSIVSFCAVGEEELPMLKATLAGVAVLSFALVANASAKTYDFTFSNSTDNGSGAFDVSGLTVESVSGVVDGLIIKGLSSYAGSDQQLSPTAPFVDFPGISFFTSADSYNLFSNPGDLLLKASVDPIGYPQNGQPITLNISAVPEPGVWAMMLAGAGLMGASLRLSKRRSSALAV